MSAGVGFSALAAAAIAGAPQASAEGSPADEVLTLTNAERTKAGCKPLKSEARLTKAAQSYTEEMASRNFLDHGDVGGRIRASGYKATTWAENIAAGQRSAQEVVRSWMNSSGHRQNILNCGLKDLGVGYAKARNGTPYWTQDFGTTNEKPDAGKPGGEQPGKPGGEQPGKPGKPGGEQPGKPGGEQPGKPGKPGKPTNPGNPWGDWGNWGDWGSWFPQPGKPGGGWGDWGNWPGLGGGNLPWGSQDENWQDDAGMGDEQPGWDESGESDDSWQPWSAEEPSEENQDMRAEEPAPEENAEEPSDENADWDAWSEPAPEEPAAEEPAPEEPAAEEPAAEDDSSDWDNAAKRLNAPPVRELVSAGFNWFGN